MKKILSFFALGLLILVLAGTGPAQVRADCYDTGCTGDLLCKGPVGSGACVANPAAPGVPASSVGTGQSFVSLSNVPGLGLSPTAGTPVPSLVTFLQDLYNICIGIAVVLAVLQLIRGGITYMLGDSITSVEEAKHLIMVSILGLVLVLSPYIVFSIINPAILQLNISGDVSKILPSTSSTGSSGPGTPGALSGSDSTSGSNSTTSTVPAPSNLQTTSQTSTSVSLSWTAPSDASNVTGYDIYNGSQKAASTVDTSVTLSGSALASSGSNSFTVVAHDASGNPSAPSNALTVTTSATSQTGYYIFSRWNWAGQSLTTTGEASGGTATLEQTGRNCWAYTSSTVDYPVNGTAAGESMLQVCQQDMQQFINTENQNAAQYPGYKKGVVDYQCTQSATANVTPQVTESPSC